MRMKSSDSSKRKAAAPAAKRPRRPRAAVTSEESIHHNAASEQSSVRPSDEQIRVRAYFLSLQREADPNDPVGDWLRAERELIEGMTA